MRTRRWPVVQTFALALLIALGGLLRPLSWSAWAAAAEGAHNGSPAAVDEIRETTIANLHAGLDGLAGDVQRKVDNDIDITASAFWPAYALEQSTGAKDGFGSILAAINVGISPLSQLRNLSNIAEQLPQIAAAGDLLGSGAYIIDLTAIEYSGNGFSSEINGPAYISGINNMYHHAREDTGKRKAQLPTQEASTNSSRPTTNDIRGAVEGEVHARFRGGLQVLDIHKTDGQTGQWLGAPTYTLEFWVLTAATHSLCVETVWHTWAPYESQFCSSTEPILRAGAKYGLAGRAYFTMKESGWVLTGVTAAELLNAVRCSGTAQINGVEHTYEALGSPLLGGTFIIDQTIGIAFTLFSEHPAAARIDIARHKSEPLAYVWDGDRPDVSAMLRNAMSRPGENWTVVPLKAPSCRTGLLNIDDLYVHDLLGGEEEQGVTVSTTPKGKANNLIVLVHGCCTNSTGLGWWNALANQMADAIATHQASTAWEIVVWDWTKNEKTGEYQTPVPPIWDVDNYKDYADIAYTYAGVDAKRLAETVNAHSKYDYIHLIGHSAGVKLVDQAAKWLAVLKKRRNMESPFIHLTFLDAYTPHNDNYGAMPNDYLYHFSEHYVDIGLPYTDAILPGAYNFNITDWKPVTSEEKRDFGHQWPRYWYAKSISSPGFRYGYPLSREGGDYYQDKLSGHAHDGRVCHLSNTTTECYVPSALPAPPVLVPTPTPPQD